MLDQPEEKEDDLDATDDGEPSEEAHGGLSWASALIFLSLSTSSKVAISK